MRRKEDFILRQIADEYLLIPTGAATAKLSGMITLSETSAFVWEQLSQERTVAQLVRAVRDTYEVSAVQAEADVARLVNTFIQLDLLENNN